MSKKPGMSTTGSETTPKPAPRSARATRSRWPTIGSQISATHRKLEPGEPDPDWARRPQRPSLDRPIPDRWKDTERHAEHIGRAPIAAPPRRTRTSRAPPSSSTSQTPFRR